MADDSERLTSGAPLAGPPTIDFASATARWEAKLGNVRDLVRQELVARHLMLHLPEPTTTMRILDVGCGQGTQSIRLAARGYHVTGVDPSDELLDRARADAARALSGPEIDRVNFRKGTLESLGGDSASDGTPGSRSQFDVVCCHGVLMYLPSLSEAMQQLIGLVAPGGILSVLTRNQSGIAMRAGMSRRWQAAIDGFAQTHYDNRLGVTSVRADSPSDVVAAAEASGARCIAWYGVRLFTDHWDDTFDVDDLDTLIEAEYTASLHDPYKQLCALTHAVFRNASE